MKVSTEPIADREVELTIEPEPEVVRRAMRQAARRLSRMRPIAGYRPGKAPYVMVERVFGRDTILNEALHRLAPDLYEKALKEAELEPYAQGQLDIESEDPLVLKASVPLQPTVALGDVDSLSITPEPEVAVSEEQIADELTQLQRANAELEPVERPAEMGDVVEVTILGTEGEETVVDQRDVQLMLEEDTPPPGFAEAVTGMSADETREFTLTYPDDYEEERLAGKAVEFSVSVAQVYEMLTPELDDDLAQTVGDYETIDELREAVAENLSRRLEAEARQREIDAALEKLVEAAEVAYPVAALDEEIQHELQRFESRLVRSGLSLSTYLNISGQTMEQLMEEVRPVAERRLTQRLVLNEYARAQSLSLSNEELQRGVLDTAASYGEHALEVLEQLNDQRNLLPLYGDLLAQKALRHLVAKLTGRPWEEDAEEASGDGEADDASVSEEPVAEAAAEPASEGATEADAEQEA
ncbi:MAG: trigger factor [Anaerolineae bacterium]